MIEMQWGKGVVDLIEIMIAQGWNLEKPLTAEMTESSWQCSNVYWNLPEPVVVIAPQKSQKIKYDRGPFNRKGEVILNPNEDRSRYGDLLNEYSSDDDDDDDDNDDDDDDDDDDNPEDAKP